MSIGYYRLVSPLKPEASACHKDTRDRGERTSLADAFGYRILSVSW